MQTDSGRLQKVRSLALVLTALSCLLVLVSAYIRLNAAGLGCVGWPDCYGQVLVGGPHPHTGTVRIVHRIAASLLLLLGFFVAWHCTRPAPMQPVARHATLLLALMILLTFVGLFSSDAHRAWASFLNMLGGVGLVSVSWLMVLAAGSGTSRPTTSGSSVGLRAGLVALAMAIALGALIGARYAAISCASAPSCAGVWWPTADGWAALNPFVTVAAPPSPGDAGGVALHLVHRYLAAAAMLLVGIPGLQALKAEATRATGTRVLVLLAIEFALGSLMVLSGFSLWLAIAHSVCAAALMAAGIQLLKEPAGVSSNAVS